MALPDRPSGFRTRFSTGICDAISAHFRCQEPATMTPPEAEAGSHRRHNPNAAIWCMLPPWQGPAFGQPRLFSGWAFSTLAKIVALEGIP